MRTTAVKTALLVAVFSAGLGACKKEAGKGGKSDVHVKVIRGDNSVVGATVKVKYGASEFPGQAAAYDDTQTTDNLAGCSFYDLRRGDYYFYATFTDVSLDTVFQGGIYVRIADPGETHTVIDFAEANPF